MLRHVALSPCNNWPPESLEFYNGARFVEASVLGSLDFDSWDYFLPKWEVEELKQCRFWLLKEYDGPHHDSEPGAIAVNSILNVKSGVLILSPADMSGLIFLANYVNGDFTLRSSIHHPRFHGPARNEAISIDSLTSAELSRTITGIEIASERSITPLTNAINLLENGLQATNVHIRLLFFSMGLDALSMASNAVEFTNRIANLLGPDLSVFPRSSAWGTRSPHRVGQLVSDIYELRSIVAHASRIPSRFRKSPVKIGGASDSVTPLQKSLYRDLLCEAALFMLCSALRKIFLDDLVDVVSNPKQWRSYLKKSGG